MGTGFKNLLFALLLVLSCSSDVSIIQKVEEVLPPGTVVVDSYIQPEKPEKIDVLVILDTSCSMDDNYEQVSKGVEILRGDIEVLTDDYQIGFINSSLAIRSSGTYYVGPFDKTSTMIDILLAPWQLSSDYVEEAFRALYDFRNFAIEAEEFFRPDADKLFIFISDEDEQSTIPADIFNQWLDAEFAHVRHDIVTINVLESSTCEYYYEIGQKYIDLSTLYGKMAIDICSDWDVWIAESSFLVNSQNYIPLSQYPDETTIVVYVDHVLAPLEDWYYLPKTNTVYLEFEPNTGSLIEVGYLTNY